MIHIDELLLLLVQATEARTSFFDDDHESAFRLFNGFVEGCPELVVDVYGRTAVLHNYAKSVADGRLLVQVAQAYLLERLPWLQAVLVKTRQASEMAERKGVLVWGTAVDTYIREHDVRYAIDLCLNQDCSFYLDTRNLRQWILHNLTEARVLNTFAYTGSLGVAARAAASQVVHVDLNKQFLNLAKRSYTLNGFPIHKKEFITGDFFPVIKQLNRQGALFDCVLLDPPFFSTTARGTVDVMQNMTQLINKVRPLVRSDGRVVVINNALFASGQEVMASLHKLCADGYVTIESLLPIADDFAGFAHTRLIPPISDPTPFNHSTKITILKIDHNVSQDF